MRSDRRPKNENLVSEHRLSKNDGKNKVKPVANKPKDCINNDRKYCSKKDSDVGLVSQISIANGKLFQPKEKSTRNLQVEQKDEGKRKVSDVTNKHVSEMSTKGKNSALNESDLSEAKRGKKDGKKKEKAAEMEKDPESEDFETPSMSFEEYLSYDLEAPKRKKRLCQSKNSKRIKVDQNQNVKMCESSTNSGKSKTEAPATVVNTP